MVLANLHVFENRDGVVRQQVIAQTEQKYRGRAALGCGGGVAVIHDYDGLRRGHLLYRECIAGKCRFRDAVERRDD